MLVCFCHFFVDVVLLPPILFNSHGGEFDSIITKSRSAVMSLVAPWFPFCLVILFLQGLTIIGVTVYLVSLEGGFIHTRW